MLGIRERCSRAARRQVATPGRPRRSAPRRPRRARRQVIRGEFAGTVTRISSGQADRGRIAGPPGQDVLGPGRLPRRGQRHADESGACVQVAGQRHGPRGQSPWPPSAARRSHAVEQTPYFAGFIRSINPCQVARGRPFAPRPRAASSSIPLASARRIQSASKSPPALIAMNWSAASGRSASRAHPRSRSIGRSGRRGGTSPAARGRIG